LGAGKIAHDFAADLSHCENGALAGAASRRIESAKALTRINGGKAYDSVNAMLADPDIDVIYIASPNALHAEHCEMALNAGKAVLCEKPFALSAKDAARIQKLAKSKNLFCMEAMWTRFLPLIQDVKAIVDSGDLGTINSIRAELGFPFAYDEGSRLGDSSLGGGALMDLGVYGISLAHYLRGAPNHVQGSAVLCAGGADEHSTSVLNYDTAQAVIIASHASELQNTFTIAGDKSRIEINAHFIQGKAAQLFSYTRENPNFGAGPSGNSENPVKTILKKTGLFSAAKTLKNIARPNGAPKLRHDYPGHGYQFQAQAVGKALRAGDIQSDIMPMAETIAVLKTLDAIKKGWS
jgi:predicted dehydrogenase